LIGGGGGDALTGLQNLTILVAAPFTLVMVGLCWALLKDLRRDPLIVRGERGEEAVEMAVIAGHEKYDGEFEIRIGPATTSDADSSSGDGDGDGADRSGDRAAAAERG
ncbi:BCCT family transporter, partial [Streptomyces sp. NPDC059426]